MQFLRRLYGRYAFERARHPIRASPAPHNNLSTCAQRDQRRCQCPRHSLVHRWRSDHGRRLSALPPPPERAMSFPNDRFGRLLYHCHSRFGRSVWIMLGQLARSDLAANLVLQQNSNHSLVRFTRSLHSRRSYRSSGCRLVIE